MLFRSRERAGGAAVAREPQSVDQMFEAIESLTRENRERRDPELERRILMLRHRAGAHLADPDADQPELVEPDFEALPDGTAPPEVTPDQLTPELLRAGMLRDGCMLVRGLLDRTEALRMADDIDRSFEALERHRAGESGGGGFFEEFEPAPPADIRAERGWVTEGGGIWIADSPKLLFEVLDTFERSGLKSVISDYLGERPALSVNKCTLRRVKPDIFKGNDQSAWHQDGAFLGAVRAVNVWLSLSRCGDLAPGMDIVPRRLAEIVPTGTEGATFDWSVSREIAEDSAGEVGVVRPIFEPGDVLLFDEMFLHSTAADASMPNTRYAVESWFFAPSGFPREYVPLAF